ncbi:MAG: orotidine-5'-phosphate decarboxylase [Bacteroidota bacterium]
MTRTELISLIRRKQSFLCIGLDTDLHKIPSHLLKTEDPVFEFNKAIIDATHELAVAYKPNMAFYESMGVMGWNSLARTEQYLRQFHVFTIADAKRGDIGNTSKQYARAMFDPESSGLDFDAVTVAPYMGEDSVKPFLEFDDKWVILLALTSNAGSDDFQMMTSKETNFRFFEEVMIRSLSWGTESNMMYVVGATRAEKLEQIRNLVPDHFLLIPGVGAQGGTLEEVSKYGLNKDCGLLVNSSRGIIYASNGEDFAEKAREEALKLQQEMSQYLTSR